MAAPTFSTFFQPFVYQSQQDCMTQFQILGGESQIVQIMLKPGEMVRAKPGSMCYMSASIQIENIYAPENEAGVLQWIFGRTVSRIVLRNTGTTDGYVGIAASSLAKILPIDLEVFGGQMLCQPDTFLCSVSDVEVNNNIRNVVPGIEGFLRQRISGRGLAFLVGGGSVVQKNLKEGEVLVVDLPSIIALTSTINAQITYNGPIRRAVFGGENLVTAVLTGPGLVFIQTMPFLRLSQRIARAVTSPNVRDNPRLFLHITLFFLIAYVVVASTLFLSDI